MQSDECETLRAITDAGFATRMGVVERLQAAIEACIRAKEGT